MRADAKWQYQLWKLQCFLHRASWYDFQTHTSSTMDLKIISEVLQTCRALMIAAIGLGFLGILLSVLGMKCTSVGASNHKAKARTALLGGLMLGVAGRYVHAVWCCTGALCVVIRVFDFGSTHKSQTSWCLSCSFKVFYRWVEKRTRNGAGHNYPQTIWFLQ